VKDLRSWFGVAGEGIAARSGSPRPMAICPSRGTLGPREPRYMTAPYKDRLESCRPFGVGTRPGYTGLVAELPGSSHLSMHPTVC
jgi:hypothetical protein